MSYKDFELEDFLAEESFQNWVKNGKEDQFWSNWLEQNPSKKETAEQAVEILKAAVARKNEVPQEKINSSWIDLERQLVSSDTGSMQQLPIQKESQVKNWMRYAAVVSLILVSVAIYFFSSFQSNRITYTTEYGQKNEIQLDDGSKVLLNSNSELITFENWDQSEHREVTLVRGEAYFEVEKKDSKKPKFVVKSENLNIEVLGTKFNVSKRRGLTKVMLVSGVVKLTTTDQSQLMQPGEYYEYSHSTDLFSTDQNSGKSTISWINNEIILDKSSLQEIATILEDRFGKKIKIENEELKSRELSGTVSDNDLMLILNVIKSSLGVEIGENGQEILIK